MSRASLVQQANKQHRHWLVFTAYSQEEQVAIWARCGLSTKAIARRAKISPAQAQYRISKAQQAVGAKFRAEYRDGSALAYRAVAAVEETVREEIKWLVAAEYMPLAAEGVATNRSVSKG